MLSTNAAIAPPHKSARASSKTVAMGTVPKAQPSDGSCPPTRPGRACGPVPRRCGSPSPVAPPTLRSRATADTSRRYGGQPSREGWLANRSSASIAGAKVDQNSASWNRL